MAINVLLLGSGGREHALAWKLAQSKHLDQLFIAPGNPGTAACGTNVNLNVNDFESIRDFVWTQNIQMVVVGPEEPLVNGIWDFFKADPVLASIPVIGPSQAGAQLEGSKAFSKAFMSRHNIPTARYAEFEAHELEAAKAWIAQMPPPYVLKADGLAAGKGVIITSDQDEAFKNLNAMLNGSAFGKAGQRLVIESFLKGIEVSMFVLTDGSSYIILPEAKDYKRIGNGDTGLNTGGMGAVSPVPFVDDTFTQKVKTQIIEPVLKGLKSESIAYQGFLFIGLMNCNGDPYVIEFNCRMGDPETEVVIPRIESDLLDVFIALSKTALHTVALKVTPRSAISLVMVSGGYPESYLTGKAITIDYTATDMLLFHAGTTIQDQQLLTRGGRVFALTAFGDTLTEAQKKVYSHSVGVQYEGKYQRSDIGDDLLQYA